LIAVLVFWMAGVPWASSPIIAVLSSWMLVTRLWDRLIRQQSERGLTRLVVLISMVDLTLVNVGLVVADGVWWLGPTMHLMLIAAGALSLQFAALIAVTVYGACAYALLIFGETLGWWIPTQGDGVPTVVGRWGTSVEIVVIAWLAIFAAVLLLWGFHQRLQRVYRRFREVFEASPYIIFTVRPDGSATSGNPAARHFGVASNVAQPIDGLLSRMEPDARAPFARQIEQALLGVGGELDLALRRDDGALRWLRMTFTPTGSITERRALVMGADITDERSAAQARDRLEREVESAGRMRLVGQLVSGVAHELNNPLAAILNYGELLQAQPRPTQDAEALEVIHAQAMRARAIVRDLLHVARASGARTREMATVDAITRRALHPLTARAADAGVVLQLTVDGEIQSQRVDVPGIEQVVTNLVSNAIDAAPHGTVLVSVRGGPDGSWIEVRDSGGGIPAGQHDQIFEPFYTTKSPGSGTGLGLAVSRGIVEQHGGTITVENAVDARGVGACFRVWLPMAHSCSSRTAEREVTVSIESPAAAGVPRIRQALLVDDEAVVRAPMARALRNNGWVVTECSDGEAALALLCGDAGLDVDVIISDIKMPRVDGPTFYRRLAAERPAMASRVLFATGDTASEEIAHFLAASRCPVIEKPFTLKSLVEQVTRMADGASGDVSAPAPHAG
jgi:PAS domain S-box-containing protein